MFIIIQDEEINNDGIENMLLIKNIKINR